MYSGNKPIYTIMYECVYQLIHTYTVIIIAAAGIMVAAGVFISLVGITVRIQRHKQKGNVFQGNVLFFPPKDIAFTNYIHEQISYVYNSEAM